MRIPPHELTEAVTVRTYLGPGPRGATYSPEVTTVCQFDGGRKVVKSGAGDDVVAETTLRLDPNQGVDVEAVFLPESTVTVRGRTARVITSKPYLMRGRLIYLEVTTT